MNEKFKEIFKKFGKRIVVVGVACFVVGAVAGSVAYGVYAYPWLSK